MSSPRVIERVRAEAKIYAAAEIGGVLHAAHNTRGPEYVEAIQSALRAAFLAGADTAESARIAAGGEP